jgi:RimJ/RimL family protein N-acetyltransferase
MLAIYELVVVLEGARVLLREHASEDLSAVLEYASDPTVARYVPWEANTEVMARGFLEGAIGAAGRLPRMSYALAIVDRATDELFGAARIGVESEVHRRADIGYVLRRDRWGRGYATEAAQLLVDFGFKDLGLYRIWATSHPDNPASSRVLEKIGMAFEGRIRGHMFVKGAWRDSLAYAILEPEWRTRRR